MPSNEVVEQFVALVEADRYVDAIERYYATNAVVHENQSVVRRGKQQVVEHELRFLAGIDKISCRCVRPVLMDDTHVVIRWKFEITLKGGICLNLDEIAYQLWEDNVIVDELFYYDPAQLTPTAQS